MGCDFTQHMTGRWVELALGMELAELVFMYQVDEFCGLGSGYHCSDGCSVIGW